MITMYWNLLSFLLFVGCYSLELRRENWAIRFLDIDNDRPDNSLKQIIIHEPELNLKMDKLIELKTIFSYLKFNNNLKKADIIKILNKQLKKILI